MDREKQARIEPRMVGLRDNSLKVMQLSIAISRRPTGVAALECGMTIEGQAKRLFPWGMRLPMCSHGILLVGSQPRRQL